MAARLVIRRATLQDYRGVMDIGKIYQGRDYLPALYDKYLKWFNCYVGEIDGEIVTFQSDRLVDAGATIAIAGGRVKEGYRGRGILSDVLRYVDNSYKDVTSVKYVSMTTDNVNIELNGERIKRKFKQILEREQLEMLGKVEDLKLNKFESDENKVQELTSWDLKKIFQSKAMCSKLFPGERILPSGYPFRLIPQNIPLMMDGFKFWGTKGSDQSTYKTLTVTHKYNLGKELMFTLCIYGNDAIDIQQHVLKHIQNLNQLVRSGTSTSIIIHITHPLDCLDTSFLSVFRNVGLKINKEFDINRLVAFERTIR
ncbi:probable N-acetyltransferase 16 [Patella vulgata]|uniref:probable N-acetyltransferase 16 n=1 Tax=Patella vulgata TaxID=6465 RepID=UPI0024A95BDE|nr:probable N-acetyltransferase 16 [Patella vulgata]XP_055957291.1 probable N-acetyltransferase 16 [Patella vulgata]